MGCSLEMEGAGGVGPGRVVFNGRGGEVDDSDSRAREGCFEGGAVIG
jgi:hypothetical protein